MMKLCLMFIILWVDTSHSEVINCEEKPLGYPIIYYVNIDTYIRYRYSTTTAVSKVFNPSNKSQEVIYFVNLQDSALISSFSLTLGGKTYVSHLKDDGVYRAAVLRGQTEGHILTRDSKLFQVSINIAPLEKIMFTIKYEELLQRALGKYKQYINLSPGQTVQDLKVNVHIIESSTIRDLFVPEIQVNNEVLVQPKPNENIDVVTKDNKAVITYVPDVEKQEQLGGKCFEGQLVIEYDVDRNYPCGQILVDDDYFVHFFAPDGWKPLRKLITFVLDVSGSMNGTKIKQLKEAMSTIFDELREDDYFLILKFEFSIYVLNGLADLSYTRLIFSQEQINKKGSVYNEYPYSAVEQLAHAYIASKENVAKAKEAIFAIQSGGGTNGHDAIKTGILITQYALRNIQSDVNYQNTVPVEPVIQFLTDGLFTAGIMHRPAIRAMCRELNVPPKIPIFTLGFGYGAEMSLLNSISYENQGFGKLIYEAADVPIQLKNFYEMIASPLLSNIDFNYVGNVDNSALTQRRFRSVFNGSELIVAGRTLAGSDSFEAKVMFVSFNGTQNCSVLALNVTMSPTLKEQYPAVDRIQAYKTVDDLLNERTYAETAEAKKEIDKSIADIAIKKNLVTPVTPLVIVYPNNSEAIAKIDSAYVPPQDPSYGGDGVDADVSQTTQALPDIIEVYTAPADTIITTSNPTRVPRYSKSDFDTGLRLENIVWLDQVIVSSMASTSLSMRIRGYTEPFILLKNKDRTRYQYCEAPDNVVGKCAHLGSCVLPQITQDIDKFWIYFCPIPGMFVGICCIEQAKI